jgi:hypothetical protein
MHTNRQTDTHVYVQAHRQTERGLTDLGHVTLAVEAGEEQVALPVVPSRKQFECLCHVQLEGRVLRRLALRMQRLWHRGGPGVRARQHTRVERYCGRLALHTHTERETYTHTPRHTDTHTETNGHAHTHRHTDTNRHTAPRTHRGGTAAASPETRKQAHRHARGVFVPVRMLGHPGRRQS